MYHYLSFLFSSAICLSLSRSWRGSESRDEYINEIFSFMCLSQLNHVGHSKVIVRKCTVGNLHSFSDIGNNIPENGCNAHSKAQKTLKNDIWKFWLPAFMALPPLALRPMQPWWSFACFPDCAKDLWIQNFITFGSKIAELQHFLYFCHGLLFSNFARPWRLI